MGVWDATLPSFTGGSRLKASDLTIVTDLLGALTSTWTSWTPTLTDITQGNGTILAEHRRLADGSIDFRFKFTFGSSGSAVGTTPRFTLPVTPHADYATDDLFGDGFLYDSSVSQWRPAVGRWLGTAVQVAYFPDANTLTAVNGTVPWTWAQGDRMVVEGLYYPA